MNNELSVLTVEKQLNLIQVNIKAPKSRKNDFGKYKYRSCEDILEALKPHLGESIVTVTDDMIVVQDRVYVKAVATIQYNGEKISVSAFAREQEDKKGMDSAQITGSASSYARKYALCGLFLIENSEDPDATDNTNEGKKTEKTSQPYNNYKPKQVEKKSNEEILDEIEKSILSCTEISMLLSIYSNLVKKYPDHMKIIKTLCSDHKKSLPNEDKNG